VRHFITVNELLRINVIAEELNIRRIHKYNISQYKEREPNMPKNRQQVLNRDLHIRINESLENSIVQLASEHQMKSSQVARHILTKYIHDFSTPSNLPAWMR
jgi:hypothetical protein